RAVEHAVLPIARAVPVHATVDEVPDLVVELAPEAAVGPQLLVVVHAAPSASRRRIMSSPPLRVKRGPWGSGALAPERPRSHEQADGDQPHRAHHGPPARGR